MKDLKTYIEQRISLTENDVDLLEKIFVPVRLSAKSVFIEAGKTARFLYFLSEGIVKGYKNGDGKIVVEHLVDAGRFLTSIDSFFAQTESTDYFETVTDCTLYKISKSDFDLLKQSGSKWSAFIESATNETIRCKMQRLNDFQTLTAKERYLKFMDRTPNLALHVSVENIASFLGIEPQSLSRIRSQVTI